MRDWTRRLGRLLLAGLEVVAATAVLLTVAVLGDLRAGIERGAYDPEPAGGVGFFVLLFWVASGLGLGVLLGAHAIGWRFWTERDPAAVRSATLRVTAELLAAVGVVVLAGGGTLPATVADALLDASVVVAVLALLHVAVDGIRLGRRLVGR